MLTKVYEVAPEKVELSLKELLQAPVIFHEWFAEDGLAAIALSVREKIDVNDAILLHLAKELNAAELITDDGALMNAGLRLGVKCHSPIDSELRNRIDAWEANHLHSKGLPRILRSIQRWLSSMDHAVAAQFLSQTAGGTRLP